MFTSTIMLNYVVNHEVSLIDTSIFDLSYIAKKTNHNQLLKAKHLLPLFQTKHAVTSISSPKTPFSRPSLTTRPERDQTAPFCIRRSTTGGLGIICTEAGGPFRITKTINGYRYQWEHSDIFLFCSCHVWKYIYFFFIVLFYINRIGWPTRPHQPVLVWPLLPWKQRDRSKPGHENVNYCILWRKFD